MSAILTLDDTDPSIVYSLGWGRAGSKLEYNSTTSFTRAAGTSARVTFQGTSIGVFGTIAAKDRLLPPPVSSYIIDGGAPVTFTATPAARAQYSQLFFQSPDLPSGQHTLEITHALASAAYFLDFIQVKMDTVPAATSASVSSLSSSTSESSTSASSSTTSIVSSTTSSSFSLTSLSTPSPPPTFTSSSSIIISTTSSIETKSSDSAKNDNVSSTSATKSSNGGAIAGGIIGAIIALALIVFAVLFYRRKQERKRRNEYLDYKAEGHVWTPGAPAASSSASIEPFANTRPSSSTPSIRNQQPMAQTSVPQTQSYGYAQPRYPGGYAPTAAGNPNMYNNPAYANPAPAQSAYTFASEEEDPYGGYDTRNAAYGQAQTQGYPAGAYLPPSQLMNAHNNDYGRGMPNRPY